MSQLVPSETVLLTLLNQNLRSERIPFDRGLLDLDCEQESAKICAFIREESVRRYRRKGVVVALSGGVDSSTVVALAARALGPDRVLALLMPEKDSAGETLELSRSVARHFGVEAIHEDISPILEAAGCYRRRDEAIRELIPGYGPDWKSKLVLPSVVDGESFRIFSIIAQPPNGPQIRLPLTLEVCLTIVAATNFKQRTRKMLEYYHADRLNYAVAGTPNLLESELGFFVKQGDGAADLKPIAHLYKTQVYQLAKYLAVPDEILSRPPTTDTYSLAQSQEEFYFCLPHGIMDFLLYGKRHGYTPEEVAPVVGMQPEEVTRVYRDIEAKRRVAAYLHATANEIQTDEQCKPSPTRRPAATGKRANALE